MITAKNGTTVPVIGVTGPTGSGKGYVCKFLQDLGFAWIDTDKIAREITLPGSGILDTLAHEFGADILKPDGSLDRSLLAQKSFSSRENQSRLNQITHPEIIRRSLKQAQNAADEGCTGVLLDAPLLFESGMDRECDEIVAVLAPADIRLKRILERDFLTPEQARSRMEIQHTDDFYTARANYIVRSYAPFEVGGELAEFMNKYNLTEEK